MNVEIVTLFLQSVSAPVLNWWAMIWLIFNQIDL